MQALEKMLGDLFKNLPPLPEEARKGLATAMPWLALAGGVLSLILAANMFRAATALDAFNNFVSAYGGGTSGLTIMLWVAIGLLVAQAVLSFVAFPALRANKKGGWDLMFWALLATVVYGVVSNLAGYFGINIGALVFSLLSSAVGLYLLFQVRSYFGGAATTATPVKPAATVTPATPTSSKTDKKE